MFVHTPETALRSLAIQAMCTGFWLRPSTPTHAAMQPAALPAQLDALSRAVHRVLALTPEQLDELATPDVSEVRELLAATIDVPASPAELSNLSSASALPHLDEPLQLLAGQLATGRSMVDAELRGAGRLLLLALFACQP